MCHNKKARWIPPAGFFIGESSLYHFLLSNEVTVIATNTPMTDKK
jgi:hypothetical protein